MTRRTDIYCWREVRIRVRWKFVKPVFDNFGSGIVHKNGHVSLYAVTEEMARRIMISGSVRKWLPIHYSSVVWIDVDSMEGIDELLDRMIELDWFFTVFVSGSKGYHVAFKRDAVPSDELAFKDKRLVIDHFRDLRVFKDFDLQIYHPLHLFRGVGCFHEKTRATKSPVFTHKGSVRPCSDHYEVSLLQRFVAERVDAGQIDCLWEALRYGLCYHSGPAGSRYTAIWKLAKDLARLHLTQSQIQAICEVYNASFDNPHGGEEVSRAVTDGIIAITGKGAVSRQIAAEY